MKPKIVNIALVLFRFRKRYSLRTMKVAAESSE